MSGDHPNYYIIENGQDTEKSPGDAWEAPKALKIGLVELEIWGRIESI